MWIPLFEINQLLVKNMKVKVILFADRISITVARIDCGRNFVLDLWYNTTTTWCPSWILEKSPVSRSSSCRNPSPRRTVNRNNLRKWWHREQWTRPFRFACGVVSIGGNRFNSSPDELNWISVGLPPPWMNDGGETADNHHIHSNNSRSKLNSSSRRPQRAMERKGNAVALTPRGNARETDGRHKRKPVYKPMYNASDQRRTD